MTNNILGTRKKAGKNYLLVFFMIEDLREIFPNISQKQLWKLLLTLKCRYKTFDRVWISRKEATRFWLSERQLQAFIVYLRNIWILELIWRAKASNGFLCNVYKIGKEFISLFDNINWFVKKAFKYLNPLEFVKSNFRYKTRYWKLEFKHNGNKYIIHRKGRFKDKIYWIIENKIINPYMLINNYEKT